MNKIQAYAKKLSPVWNSRLNSAWQNGHGQTMQRQLALTEISSLNLAPFHLLDPVEKSINDYQRKDKTWSIQVQPFKIWSIIPSTIE